MTAKTLEEEAREAAIDHGEWLEADHNETNYDAYVAGFLAAATARNKENAQLRTSLMLTGANFDSAVKEIEELRALVNDWRESAKKAAGESCGDEAHCSCVGPLRARITELSALVCYTTFHHGYYSYEPPETRNESFYFTPPGVGGGGVEHELPAKYQGAARLAREVLMAPPIPLPEGEG